MRIKINMNLKCNRRGLLFYLLFFAALSRSQKLLKAGKALASIIPTVQNGKVARRQRMTAEKIARVPQI